MFKKFLSGVLAAAIIVGGASYANTATADAAAAPKPKTDMLRDIMDGHTSMVSSMAMVQSLMVQ